MPPTALERYAGCGMAFFLDRVLRVRVVDEPEAVLTIDPLTKGSVVHSTLERFLTELGGDDWPQPAASSRACRASAGDRERGVR